MFGHGRSAHHFVNTRLVKKANWWFKKSSYGICLGIHGADLPCLKNQHMVSKGRGFRVSHPVFRNDIKSCDTISICSKLTDRVQSSMLKKRKSLTIFHRPPSPPPPRKLEKHWQHDTSDVRIRIRIQGILGWIRIWIRDAPIRTSLVHTGICN